ncbi:hypothetical protein [Sphingomonas sp. M1A8_2b]
MMPPATVRKLERRLNTWLKRSGLMRLLLWTSALLSILLALRLYHGLPISRNILSFVSALFAIGALAVSRHFRKVERPSSATWLAGIAFLLPLLIYVAEFMGLFDTIARLTLRR